MKALIQLTTWSQSVLQAKRTVVLFLHAAFRNDDIVLSRQDTICRGGVMYLAMYFASHTLQFIVMKSTYISVLRYFSLHKAPP